MTKQDVTGEKDSTLDSFSRNSADEKLNDIFTIMLDRVQMLAGENSIIKQENAYLMHQLNSVAEEYQKSQARVTELEVALDAAKNV